MSEFERSQNTLNDAQQRLVERLNISVTGSEADYFEESNKRDLHPYEKSGFKDRVQSLQERAQALADAGDQTFHTFPEKQESDTLPRVTLEIGVAFDAEDQSSVPVAHRYYEDGKEYIGIGGEKSRLAIDEPDREELGLWTTEARTAIEAAQTNKMERLDGHNLHYSVADARNMLLAGESVDEIYMKDVIVSPGMIADDALNIAQECYRVLKDEGTLHISERDQGPGGQSTVGDEKYYQEGILMQPTKFDVLGEVLAVAGFKIRAISTETGSWVTAIKSKELENEPPRSVNRRNWLKRIRG